MKNLEDFQREKLSFLRKKDPRLEIQWDSAHKQVAYVRGNMSESFDLERLRENPFDAAKEFLQDNKELFGNLDIENELVKDRRLVDNIGMTHVSFQQCYKGVPVFGGSVRVHFDRNGRISSISSKLVPDLDISTDPKILASKAEKVALEHAGEGAVTVEERAPQLIIFPQNEEFYLCWKVQLDGHAQKEPAEWIYFIDAEKGNVIFHYNDLCFAGPTTGEGKGYYSGSGKINTYDTGTGVYQLKDVTRSPDGPEILTNDEDGASPSEDSNNNWDDQTDNPRDQNQCPEVDVHRYVGKAVNYFRDVHGRNSYDGKGADVKSDVHWGDGLNNARWSLLYGKLLFGDGDGIKYDYFSADDIVAHEFTHAITYQSFIPRKKGEPAAIDEAISDCFAAFITGDWLFAEIRKDRDGPERNSLNPTNDGQYDPDPNKIIETYDAGHCPDHYDDLYKGDYDYGGMHINSTIISHAIYLMTVGGTHRKSGVTVASIGQAAVEKMLYNVQTAQLMGNDTPTFLDFREAMINACLALYPKDLEKLASVKAAFKAVGIGPDLFLRDTVDDVGKEPNPDGLSYWSPDIIVRKKLPDDPQTEFADPSRDDLSQNVEFGQPNYVFVRITNNGNHMADAKIDLYFCEITTFASPSAWEHLGTIDEYDIMSLEFRVSKHFVVPSEKITKMGHAYCFVAVVSNPLDPAPDYKLISSIDEFNKFILYSNNYAWKNVEVRDDISGGEPITMGFDIYGILKSYTKADLEIDLRNLPKGTEFQIRLPHKIFRGLDLVGEPRLEPQQLDKEYSREEAHDLQPSDLHRQMVNGAGRACFIIKPGRAVRLKRLSLKPGKKAKAVVTVRLPQNVKGDKFTFSVRQIVNNIAVGQVNYVLHLKEKGPV